MTTSQEALRRLAAADPIPSPKAMPSAAWSSVVLLDRIDERSGGTEAGPPTEHLRPTPPIRRERGPLIAITIAVVVLAIGAAAVILTLSGDRGNDVISPSPTTTDAVQALQPGPISSFEDIAGTYLRRGPGDSPTYLLFLEDGTVQLSSNPDMIVESPAVVYQTRFVGTEIFITQTSLSCDQPDQGGTYEIHALGNGNLRFVAVDEDTCAHRSGFLLGPRDGVVTAEYEPVP